MFTIDPQWLLILFVVAPIIALVCYKTLTTSVFNTLSANPELMKLPLYSHLYSKSDGSSDLPDRTLLWTLVPLGLLYACILALVAPFANRLLGMLAWLFSVSAGQAVYVLFFDACLIGLGCALFQIGRSALRRQEKPLRLLPLAILALLLAGASSFAMAHDTFIVVYLACKKEVLGVFGFFVFGAMLYGANDDAHSDSAIGDFGMMLLNLFLTLLTVGSLVSTVS